MTLPSKRIGYIDALRGFTMILVVFSHIYIPNDTTINQFFVLFRMPLFFFISGFISFRREQSWTGRETITRLGSKLRTMIFPALTLGLLFTLVYNQTCDPVPITDFFTRPTKMGYWFTFALFNMLVIYYTARYLRERGRASLESFAKWFFLVALVAFFALSDLSSLGDVDKVLTLSLTFEYLQYFAFGALCSCRREAFERTLDSGWRMAVVVVGLFVLAWWIIATDNYMVPASCNIDRSIVVALNAVVRAMTGYFGIVTIFALFRRAGEAFAENKFVGKPLQFVGRNTLDVYLLHYFVLLNFPALLRPFVVDTTGIIVPLVVGLTVAILVVAVSLLISRIIRTSDLLAYYLLGARDVKLATKHKASN